KLALQKRDAEIRKEISDILAGGGMSGEASHQLAAWDPYDQNASAPFFDPEWMYGITDGFDVAIGNPPYVSHDQLTNKNSLRTFAVYEPFADLYCYFIEKSVKLTSPNGTTCLITSNSFIKADYGKPLRQFLVSCAPIEKLLNIEDSQVFKSAIVNVAILLARREGKLSRVMITNEKCTDENFRQYVASKSFLLSPAAFRDSQWILREQSQLDVHNKLRVRGRTLTDMNAFIRLGLATGANDAFIISKTQAKAFIDADPKNGEIIKPILRGREIDRYIKPNPTSFVLLAKNGVNVPRDYPAIFRHLDGFGARFKKRGAQGQNWWNLRACAFYDKFKFPKVVWIELTDRARFTYCDENEILLLNSAYFLVPPGNVSVKFLTGILNSKCVEYFFNNIAATSGMGTTRWINAYVKQFPIPFATKGQQSQIEQLVEQIRAAKEKQSNSDVTTIAIEAEIDQIVYKLYDLTPDEIAIVEKRSR
ncbi:MAG: Eco57I restriction-modification methylase domain-containing protein, partial [Methanosarcinaceae archaeon]|nr:Eco57I restriction-modification methylase domain-containing protein [Methanosarcinaceae archaeon]